MRYFFLQTFKMIALPVRNTVGSFLIPVWVKEMLNDAEEIKSETIPSKSYTRYHPAETKLARRREPGPKP